MLRDLRDRLYSHLHELSLSFYASSRTGDLQSRISNDVGGVQTAVTTTLSNILSNLVVLIGAIVAMLILSVPLTLLSVATVPFFVVATRVVGRRREAYTAQAQAATAEMSILPLEKAKEDFQRRYVLEILERNNGNRTQTARDLGVDPRTIFRYLEKESKPVPAKS